MERAPGKIEERIKANTVTALKSGDKDRTRALRMLTAALKKARIDAGEEPSEAAELQVLKRERKRRLESAELYEQGGRPDLASKERSEEKIIAGYLPEELGEAELAAIVDNAVAETGAATPKDMGKVMGVAMKKVAGRADGKLVNTLVRARLGA